MKFRTVIRTSIVAFIAALALGMAPRAQAQECSLAGVAGKYAFSDSGTVVAIGTTVVNYPRSAVALLTLDAAGNINGKVTASLNGTITRTTLSGTYTVNPDCTGATSFSESDAKGNLILTGTADFVWDDNVQELRFIFSTPVTTVINGSARKLFTENQQ